jgi:hypothetical protein
MRTHQLNQKTCNPSPSNPLPRTSVPQLWAGREQRSLANVPRAKVKKAQIAGMTVLMKIPGIFVLSLAAGNDNVGVFNFYFSLLDSHSNPKPIRFTFTISSSYPSPL